MKIFGNEINEMTSINTLDTSKRMLELNIKANEEYIDRYKEDVKAWLGILTRTKDTDTYTSIRKFIDEKQKYIDKYIDELHEFMKQMKYVCELIDVKNDSEKKEFSRKWAQEKLIEDIVFSLYEKIILNENSKVRIKDRIILLKSISKKEAQEYPHAKIHINCIDNLKSEELYTLMLKKMKSKL